MSSDDLWPSNPKSLTPAKRIDWQPIPPETFQAARVALVRKVDKCWLELLATRYKHMFALMTPAAQEQVRAIIEGRKPDPDILETEPPLTVEPTTKTGKTKVLAEVERLKSEAAEGGDIASRIKLLELEAKLEALLHQKEQVDPVITINVITGVPRG